MPSFQISLHCSRWQPDPSKGLRLRENDHNAEKMVTQARVGKLLGRASKPSRVLDTQVSRLYDGRHMEIDLTPELEAKLTRLAAEQGRETRALVREAVERFVDYDEWFVREVEKGLAAADRGELVDHEEIGKLIDHRYPG
jgi:predicted transcriptional regulator